MEEWLVATRSIGRVSEHAGRAAHIEMNP